MKENKLKKIRKVLKTSGYIAVLLMLIYYLYTKYIVHTSIGSNLKINILIIFISMLFIVSELITIYLNNK